MKRLGIFAALAVTCLPAPAYYHYVHYLNGTNVLEKFDLTALTNNTVTFFVSEAGPVVYNQTDTFNSVVAQIAQATQIWNGVSASNIRVAFGGLENGSTLPPENNGCATIRGKLLLDGLPPKGGVILALNPGLNATIAPDGTFKFDSAAPGKYSLSMRDSTLLISAVEAQGARLVNDSLDVPADAAVELTIKAVATETLASLEGIAMQGNVAVGGAMVLLLPRDAAN